VPQVIQLPPPILPFHYRYREPVLAPFEFAAARYLRSFFLPNLSASFSSHPRLRHSDAIHSLLTAAANSPASAGYSIVSPLGADSASHLVRTAFGFRVVHNREQIAADASSSAPHGLIHRAWSRRRVHRIAAALKNTPRPPALPARLRRHKSHFAKNHIDRPCERSCATLGPARENCDGEYRNTRSMEETPHGFYRNLTGFSGLCESLGFS